MTQGEQRTKVYLSILSTILLAIIALSPFYGNLITDEIQRKQFLSENFSYDFFNLAIPLFILLTYYKGNNEGEKQSIKKGFLMFGLLFLLLILLEIFTIFYSFQSEKEILYGWVNGVVFFSVLCFISIQSYKITESPPVVREFMIYSLLVFLTIFVPLWFPNIGIITKFSLRIISYIYLLVGIKLLR